MFNWRDLFRLFGISEQKRPKEVVSPTSLKAKIAGVKNSPDDFSKDDMNAFNNVIGAAKHGHLGIVVGINKKTGKKVPIMIVVHPNKPLEISQLEGKIEGGAAIVGPITATETVDEYDIYEGSMLLGRPFGVPEMPAIIRDLLKSGIAPDMDTDDLTKLFDNKEKVTLN